MTEPVILYGTQSNGETLPVQVDNTGRLVAEGLEGPRGPEGPQGPEGPEGPPGPPIDLPPDPYEGALLGWLNGGLAWIGTPPVPVPPGLFGPIVSWNPDGTMVLENAIPEGVGPGVFFTQTNFEQLPIRNDQPWLVSYEWSDMTSGGFPVGNWSEVFSLDFNDGPVMTIGSGTFSLESIGGLPGAVCTLKYQSKDGGPGLAVNGVQAELIQNDSIQTIELPISGGVLDTVTIGVPPVSGGTTKLFTISVDNKVLVDKSVGQLRGRISEVINDTTLIIEPVGSGSFSVGAYGNVDSQRVAPWVLYGNDPTSRIDYLRRTRD